MPCSWSSDLHAREATESLLVWVAYQDSLLQLCSFSLGVRQLLGPLLLCLGSHSVLLHMRSQSRLLGCFRLHSITFEPCQFLHARH